LRTSIYIFYFLLSLTLFSCANIKRTARLKSENKKLLAKVDSLSNELNVRTIALAQAQKTISQLYGAKKPSSARKKIESSDQERVTLFVHNITKYVEWKTENNFVIGVVGDEKMYEKMSLQYKDKKIDNKPVVVKQMNTSKELESANLYFVSSTKLALLSEIQKKSNKNSTLIMSDVHHITDGVHINFYNENDTLHFDMNDEEIKKSQLVISSSLKNLEK
jgi:hypothetical protein